MRARSNSIKGLLIGLAMIMIWLGHLIFALSRDLASYPPLLMLVTLLIQAFLYTGLFITAHDAMHGSVFRSHHKINTGIGTLAVFLYALFSYKNLLKKHHEHHRFPGTERDPDFYPRERQFFFSWYLWFLRNYLHWPQLLGMALVFNLLLHGLDISIENLFLFWITPSLLSTLQLFYFGTYLTHRVLQQPFVDQQRARSNNYPLLGSFLSCYHFGYHWEHHVYPGVPWWQLPRYRQSK